MKKDIVIAVVAVVIVAAVAFGLAALRPSTPATPSQPSESAKASGEGKVVMRVNGEPITDREFSLFVMSAPEEARAFYASPAGRRALADELVKLKVLEQEAKRLGVTDDPEVRSQIAMATSQITAGRALEKLADQKMEERIRTEYEKEKGSAISLRHILVAYQGGQVPPRQGTPLSEDAAMQKAKAIEAKLRAGADFAQTARAESDDTQSGAEGGSLGPARPDMLPPDIGNAVSKLKPGEMSGPIKTQFGIHIFKVEQPSLEQLRPALRQKVRQQAAEEEVKRLQDAAKVDLDEKFFPPAPAPTAPAPPGAPKSNG